MPALEPGATLGILGGGQLGRMTAQAAARLGYRLALVGTALMREAAPAALLRAMISAGEANACT